MMTAARPGGGPAVLDDAGRVNPAVPGLPPEEFQGLRRDADGERPAAGLIVVGEVHGDPDRREVEFRRALLLYDHIELV